MSSEPIFAGAIERYRALGLWGPDPVIRREGYDRLHAAMRAGGRAEARHRLRDLRRHQPRQAGGRQGDRPYGLIVTQPGSIAAVGDLDEALQRAGLLVRIGGAGRQVDRHRRPAARQG